MLLDLHLAILAFERLKADFQGDLGLATFMGILRRDAAPNLQTTEELTEVVFDSRQVHLVEQNQQHPIAEILRSPFLRESPAALRCVEEAIHLHECPAQLRRAIAVFQKVEEPEHVLWTVPSRLHCEAEKM